MSDCGLTHIALAVRNLQRSLAFYKKYAHMEIVHQRADVLWISDHTRPFVIVLVETENHGPSLGPISHLGVAVETRDHLDQLINQARLEKCLEREPTDAGPPVGYWAFLKDPDGNILELSYGQEINHTIENNQTNHER